MIKQIKVTASKAADYATSTLGVEIASYQFPPLIRDREEGTSNKWQLEWRRYQVRPEPTDNEGLVEIAFKKKYVPGQTILVAKSDHADLVLQSTVSVTDQWWLITDEEADHSWAAQVAYKILKPVQGIKIGKFDPKFPFRIKIVDFKPPVR